MQLIHAVPDGLFGNSNLFVLGEPLLHAGDGPIAALVDFCGEIVEERGVPDYPVSFFATWRLRYEAGCAMRIIEGDPESYRPVGHQESRRDLLWIKRLLSQRYRLEASFEDRISGLFQGLVKLALRIMRA